MSNAILGPCLDHVAVRASQAGLPVVKFDGWRARTSRASKKANGGRYEPIGVIDHHTAPPVPFPLDRLTSKCNISIRNPDGAVCLLNAGWAHDSGWGDRLVLEAVRSDGPRPEPTDTYKTLRPDPVPGGANPGVLGNPFFIDIEVQHPGDASPLLEVMHRALIVTNAAICEFMRWDPDTRVIGHREWTRRKPDPKWDGKTNPMSGLRTETIDELGPTTGMMRRAIPSAGQSEEEDGMWHYLTVGRDLVQHAWEQGWLQPKTQATLDFFLAAVTTGEINDPTWGDFRNFRVAVSNGIALSSGRTQ
jgi:hypothetical protein